MQIAMHTIRKRIRTIAFGLAATGMVLASVASVAAANLTTASLSLSDPRPDETSVVYTFDASSFSGTTLECVVLELNDQADMGGSVPSSIDTTSSTLDSSSAITAGSWTYDNSVNGVLEMIDGSEAASDGNIVYGAIVNGDTVGTTYFAQLRTYTNNDCSTGPVDSVAIAFVYTDGELVQLEVEPTLTFTCTGLGSGVDVNGTNTTLTNTCTGVDFQNNVTSSTNGIAGHNLNVVTNANAGYVVYLRHTADLTNENSDTIDVHAGTNGSPTSFAAAGSEAWGYTTEDVDLAGGTNNRFSGGNWAGFTTSNEEVMDDANATPGSGDDVEVAYQAGIAANTEAGTYQTTIIYTLVATF